MDSELPSKKHVSIQQMLGLIDFLKEHQELATGLSRGRRGKVNTLKLWNLCAKKLNALENGSTKNGRGWSKYWCDWKYRVRRRALQLKAAKDSNKPGPPVLPLSDIEERLMSVIGEDFLDGVVIKTDPLGEENTEDEDNADTLEESSVNDYATSSDVRKRHRSVDAAASTPPSTPPERKPRMDHDEEAVQFLRLEREHLENSRKIEKSISIMASEVTRLADVLTHIRDILINNGVPIN